MSWKINEPRSINPMDRPCCMNCKCLFVKNSDEGLKFCASADCPHRDGTPFHLFAGMSVPLEIAIRDQYVKEVSALWDFVCNSWEGRGNPLNLDGEERE
ncbi:MAG: hypothetical protein IJG69_09470 [Spirochaetales bacterium]|nr:hypothetical protein [Spirochaetales bacterium]